MAVFPSYVEFIRLVWSGGTDGLQLRLSQPCWVCQFSVSLAHSSCLLSAGRLSERVLTHFPLRFLVCRAFYDALVIQVNLVTLYQQWPKYVSLYGSKSETTSVSTNHNRFRGRACLWNCHHSTAGRRTGCTSGSGFVLFVTSPVLGPCPWFNVRTSLVAPASGLGFPFFWAQSLQLSSFASFGTSIQAGWPYWKDRTCALFRLLRILSCLGARHSDTELGVYFHW